MSHDEAEPGSSTSHGRRSRPLILAVDDEPDGLWILEWFLNRDGFDVITALSAIEALRIAEERLPDLIITDYMMPGMTGLALCLRLRHGCATRHIPIILHSAAQISTLPPDHQVHDLLYAKPGEILVLVGEVRRLLGRPRR